MQVLTLRYQSQSLMCYHYTNPQYQCNQWCRWQDFNLQNLEFESSMYGHSITPAYCVSEFFEELPQALLTVHLCWYGWWVLPSHAIKARDFKSLLSAVPTHPHIGVAFNSNCRNQPTREADDVAYYLSPHSGGSASLRIPCGADNRTWTCMHKQ